jgi:predicted nuclease of predicted toxin-antitoxin system
VARFYGNENIALPAVVELRRLGHDVLTSIDAGNASAAIPDSEVLAFAAREGRILLSHNRRHFLRLHVTRAEEHAGIVVCTVDADFSQLAQRIHAAVSDMKNQLIRVNRLA